jgi:thiosulfate dehydrogenase [quinone] large subunit
MSQVITRKGETVQEPKFVHTLLNDTRAGWLFLIPRLYLGYKWVDAALHKVNEPGWVQTGEALKSYWERAVLIPDAPARPAISFEWYRSFIQMMLDAEAYTWFAKLVAYGELIIGIALILGLFTGIAAFFGGFMNWNFMMAGSASTNPMLFTIALLLILGWKVSGYVGLDCFALRYLGTPWRGRPVNEIEPKVVLAS